MLARRPSLLSRLLLLGALLILGLGAVPVPPAHAQSIPMDRYFPETQHNVYNEFLRYWTGHGGLAQQGYPVAERFLEKSDLDGKTYPVQYFERAVFEYHFDSPDPNFEVQLAQLGTYRYQAKYGTAGAPGQVPNKAARHSKFFAETGHWVGGGFWDYWQQHGGLAQQGYPISDEFQEQSDLDGKIYTVQYFERAVFEFHPENRGTPYTVLLAQLGTYRLKAKYPNGPPPPSAGLIPFPAARRVNVLKMTSATEGWAVGAGILHYKAGRWTPVTPPTDDLYLEDIAMVSPTEGWAVGLGQILHYSGGQWKPDPAEVFTPLYAIDMTSATEGWAGAGSNAGGGFLHYTGGKWQAVSGAEQSIYGLDMVSAKAGWAAGWGILRYRAGKWETEAGTADAIFAKITMLSDSDGWAVGYSGIRHYQNGVWQHVPAPTGVDLLDISMVSPTEGWAVGSLDSADGVGGGVIARYQNGQWTVTNRYPGLEWLQSISMVSPTDGWAVGDRGALLHYQNGAWTAVQP
jgi:photosystem II stability/assembly factor-like uncharacterized protein